MNYNEFSKFVYPKTYKSEFSTGLIDCINDDCKTNMPVFCCQGYYLCKHKLAVEGREEVEMTECETFRGMCLSMLGVYGICSICIGLWTASLRQDLKTKFEITNRRRLSENVLVCCCYPCAICQQEREIKISKNPMV
jgi:Cys-rich protein (TIGR01571 family)